MAIITLTTDMGLNDHYVASLKGTILRSVENPTIVDISHSVRPFDIAEAAYLLSSCYMNFPDGTIHVIGVDSEPIVNFGGTEGCFPSVLVFEDQYFISNDNGFFGVFLSDKTPASFWRMNDVLSNPKIFLFPTKNLLLKMAIELLNGEKINSFADPFEGYKSGLSPLATSEPNLIRGYILHIDSYGNAITNVQRSLFDRFGKDTPFILYFKKESYFIDEISDSYNQVPEGEKVAIFNENDYLEIAINRGANDGAGGAEQLLGLNVKDMIRIEFTPQGSRKTIESLFP